MRLRSADVESRRVAFFQRRGQVSRKPVKYDAGVLSNVTIPLLLHRVLITRALFKRRVENMKISRGCIAFTQVNCYRERRCAYFWHK